MEQKKYIPALGYDFLTAYYDLAIKITMPERKFRRLLVEEINPKENEHILEFGFGTGQNLVLVQQENPKAKLEDITGKPVCYWAYPNGVYDHQAAMELSRYFKLSFIL